MTTVHIQSLLQRQSQLSQDIRHAQNLIETLERYKSSDSLQGTLHVVGTAGSVKLDAALTRHLATNALLDLVTEQEAVEAKIQAINTLLAD